MSLILHEVRHTFYKVRRTYLVSYKYRVMIAFIMRLIICPQLLNPRVKLGQRSLYIVTYESEQKQQQKGVTSSSRGKYTRWYWWTHTKFTISRLNCNTITVTEGRRTSTESYLCETICSFVVITLVNSIFLRIIFMKFTFNDMCFVTKLME